MLAEDRRRGVAAARGLSPEPAVTIDNGMVARKVVVNFSVAKPR